MTERKADSVEHQSTNPLAERIEQLKQLFPEVVNEDGVDIDTLVNLLGKEERRKERYNFTWAGKQDAILSLQKQSKATLKPAPDDSINWDSTKHLFIEGDNLEVLKLLYKSYFGRVKMIYIDPPYNTGNDFVYPDNYAEPLSSYLHLTGQVDSNGDAQTTALDRTGRKHSAWLSMMYPRLFVARQLLKDDGVIFVSIDDNEVHNLRLCLDSIFGEENFIANIVWQKKYGPANDAKQISQTHEHILIYAKFSETWKPELLPRTEQQLKDYKNPDNDPRGLWRVSDLSARSYSESGDYPITTPAGNTFYPPESRSWIVSRGGYQKLLDDNRIWFGVDGTARPYEKKFLEEVKDGITPQTWWDREFAGDNKMARYRIKEIFPENPFDTSKPVELLERIIQISTNSDGNDIVLDFFAGSATTAEAILSQNLEDNGDRQFIMVQLPEILNADNSNQKTAYDFCIANNLKANIAEISKERVRRVIDEMVQDNDESDADLGFRVFKLDESPMRQWDELPPHDTSPEEYEEQLELFVTDPLLNGWTVPDVIAEVALKEAGFSLSYRVEKLSVDYAQIIYKVLDEDQEQHFYICLDDTINLDAIESLGLSRDDLFIFRDSAVDDTIIANLALTSRIKSI